MLQAFQEQLRNGEWEDFLGIRKYLSPVTDDMVRRGFLRAHRVGNSVIVTPSLGDPRPSLVGDFPQAEQTKPVVFFQLLTKVDESDRSRVVIPHDMIPCFMAQNDIKVMDAVQLEDRIQYALEKKMALTKCQVIGEYHLSEGHVGMRLADVELLKDMNPGDIALRLKMDLDFDDAYLRDPEKFLTRLKSNLLAAVFQNERLPYDFVSCCSQHIRTVQVVKGSIEVAILIGSSLLLAASFAAALYLGRSFKVRVGPLSGEVGAREEPMDEVTFRGNADGSFEISGRRPSSPSNRRRDSTPSNRRRDDDSCLLL